MVFWLNLGFFILTAFALSGQLILPCVNLHLANSSLSKMKAEVRALIAKNRNSLDDIDSKLKAKLSKENFVDLVSVLTKDENDFKVLDIEFKYKLLFQAMNEKVDKQKLRFIVNDV